MPDQPGEQGSASLRRIDFNLLIPLQALLMEANVTRAAERTNVGQPAMSASLAKLRRHFDDPLLVRDGRELRLTPLAASLVTQVNEVVDGMHAVMNKHAPFDPASTHRVFSLVTSDYVTTVLLKPLLVRLAEEAPHVRLEVVTPRRGMGSLLRRIECDLVVAPCALVHVEVGGYQQQPLFLDHFVVVVDKDNRDIGDRIAVEELQTLPHLGPAVAPPPEFGGRPVPRLFSGAGYMTTAMHLVVGTDLVAVVPSRLFRRYGAACGLREVALDGDSFPVDETMFWHPKHVAEPDHMWLRAQLVEMAAELEDASPQQ
ncbi:LysR family transcriptional regulator [Kutzneria sp. CA-103260]|uniref:LysR family transcriptional regulator n=1 Tax=Kutzneria sp. CA-103260 TaxID=2802641 RepID=UPI001BA72FFC|nr:LysR family transcriptional regulator [Kutzneria sp. CA-103260]QUQ64250.1 LysR family transcriptional regulator [Kutzneria sp. CA-103260]